MQTGNGDLLFGQPKDLEEAVDTLLAFYGSEKMNGMLSAKSYPYADKGHYHIAEFIRNHWFLWWHEDHGNRWFPKSKPPLVSFFHDVGIVHPDDMSSILLSAAWHEVNRQPYDITATVSQIQEYWKEQGYPDGKPDTNML